MTLLALVACLAASPSPARIADEAPVMLLEGRPVSVEEFEDWAVRDRAPVLVPDFLRYELVRREAAQRGIEVAPEEVERRVEETILERIRNAFGGRRDAWLAEVRRLGRTERGLLLERRVDAETELLLERLLLTDRTIPEEAIVREWEETYGPGGRRLDLSLLLCEVPGMSRRRGGSSAVEEAAKAEVLARAEALRARLAAGTEFERLVREESDDQESRRQGGKAPLDFSLGGWPAESADAVRDLAPGEVSAPLLGPRGYWIVRMDGVVETPLDSVRSELRTELENRPPGPEESGLFVLDLLSRYEVEELPALHALPGPMQAYRPADEPVLTVAGEPVTRHEFGTWLRHTRGEDLVPRYALHWKIHALAAEAEFSTTEEEIRERVELDRQILIDEIFDGDLAAWEMDLAADGRTEESFRRELAVRVRTDLLAEKLITRDRVVEERAARDLWADRYGPGGEATYVRLLAVRAEPKGLEPGAPPEEVSAVVEAAIAEAEETARELRRQAEEGADFAALAREHSDDPETAPNGGAPGDRFRPGEWIPELAQAVADASPGDVVGPFWIRPMSVLVQVTERRVVPFEDVEEELLAELQVERPTEPELAAFRNLTTQSVDYEIREGLYS